jgi:rubrerythrin
MQDLKKEIEKSFRMEMLGTGMYRALAKQYSGRPDLSQKFQKFADDEAMHGRLFQEIYRKNYGKPLGGQGLWLMAGRIAALSMRALPLKAKLKRIGAVEAQAVRQIEEALAGDDGSGFFKVIRRILPDEKDHAALYKELFG